MAGAWPFSLCRSAGMTGALTLLASPRARRRHRFAITLPSHLLRLPRTSDFREWKTLRSRSRAFLQPWEPLWGETDLTQAGFRRRIARANLEYEAGSSIQLFIFHRNHETSQTLVGGITIGLIRRGVAQMCMLGYWMGEQYAGKGHMFAALELVIRYIFEEMRLHRIEAACIPSNERSASLLTKAGFRKEGYLRSYLRINGQWQDHQLFALLKEEYDRKGN